MQRCPEPECKTRCWKADGRFDVCLFVFSRGLGICFEIVCFARMDWEQFRFRPFGGMFGGANVRCETHRSSSGNVERLFCFVGFREFPVFAKLVRFGFAAIDAAREQRLRHGTASNAGFWRQRCGDLLFRVGGWISRCHGSCVFLQLIGPFRVECVVVFVSLRKRQAFASARVRHTMVLTQLWFPYVRAPNSS